ncbi:unnamed protein product [Penicillium nalgiovense]|uniref:SMP-30/Gluconolactonase/LRE-like region domain-containing protein n=1 Tax=Penicillium nalgiovense TaxID=60175 RepID=A0A9W4HCT5_PENNA|nr:unnamed protein product [Penicillium nalgiovense]CAG7968964.1 unnamed protein product [Penicillium nalgiovense]CAG7991818.1 unnamed protein product [Penicillium nalgiovense]CAG7993076.1 unnamed protein product [Penicillium nalgiovense]CAG7994307.1 unnamed protein product [Penicillium nalgiovense]
MALNTTGIPSAFSAYDRSFLALLGPTPKLEVLLENKTYPFAHEASVYIPTTNDLFMSSNYFNDTAGLKTITISKVTLPENGEDKPIFSEMLDTTIPMANGGINYVNESILFCGQGNMTATGGLFKLSTNPPYEAELLVGGFYGKEFTSVNDVVVHSDGSIWFTDPIYGYVQGIRPAPRLPNQVYRFDPKTRQIRVVADGFGRPNGISFSPDESVLYITDTAQVNGDGTTDYTKPATIYAFNVTTGNGDTFLTDRRVFAMADTGIPDGIKNDVFGNVYAGCGDGINTWSAGGVLLGKIIVENGASNFAFGRNGELFIMNENRLLRAQLSEDVKGALLRV